MFQIKTRNRAFGPWKKASLFMVIQRCFMCLLPYHITQFSSYLQVHSTPNQYFIKGCSLNHPHGLECKKTSSLQEVYNCGWPNLQVCPIFGPSSITSSIFIQMTRLFDTNVPFGILYNFYSRTKHQFIHLRPHLCHWPSCQFGPKPCHGPYFPPFPFSSQLSFWPHSFFIVLSVWKR